MRTSYKPSMEVRDLQMFFAAGWIKIKMVQDIIKLQIRQCTASRSICKANGEELYLVYHAIKNAAIQMHITDLEDRVGSIHGMDPPKRKFSSAKGSCFWQFDDGETSYCY